MNEKKQELLISVIICTHNRADLARDAINSVLQQEVPHEEYELLVVDNASTDHTQQVVEGLMQHHPNVRYLYEPNIGLSHARNRGWQEAKGEYVGYLDDDGRASPEWLACAKMIAETIRPEAFGGPYHAFYNTPKPHWYKDEYGSHVLDVVARPLRNSEYLNGGNMFIRCDILKTFDGFNTRLGMQGNTTAYGEETDLFNRIRAEMRDAVVYYDPSLYIYHLVRTEKFDLQSAPRRFFIAGFYFGKVFEIERRGNILKTVAHIIICILSIALTILQILKSTTWDLLMRDRKMYPFYQNHLYERTMPYFARMGAQVQYLFQKAGGG